MSLRLIRAVSETESLDDFHLARLLLLLGSADDRRTKPETKARAIEGITKLAKLDFLLRYPTCLERALHALGEDGGLARVTPRERTSIESSMIRFRYGPWDSRYRRWLALLAARGLVSLGLEGRTVVIGLTDRGRDLVQILRVEPLFEATVMRSEVAVEAVGRMSATKLKSFVYDVVPEIIDMKWGEEIAP